MGVTCRATLNLTTAMTNPKMGFPNNNLVWSNITTGSTQAEVMHYHTIGY